MEKPDPILMKEWNAKLKAEGLPTSIHIQKAVVNEDSEKFVSGISETEEENILAEAMRDILVEFSDLPEKIQHDIIEDVKNQKREGVGFKEVSDRLHILVKKGAELMNMDTEDSDKIYKPKSSLEDLKLAEENKEIDKIIKKNVDELLEKLERIRKEGIENKKEGEQNSDPENSSELPKDWVQ